MDGVVVHPKAGEPFPPFHGEGEFQDSPASAFDNVPANGKDTAAACFHLLMDFLFEHCLPEQADEIAGHHNEVQGGFGCVETLPVKCQTAGF